MRQFVSSLIHLWPPVAVFVLVALVYLVLNALLGTYLAFAVQAIALGTLFLATPLLALLCRRIASLSSCFFAAGTGGVLCAATWTGLITIYFNSARDIETHQSMFRILRSGVPSILLYVPLIWLARGVARPVRSDDDHPPAEMRMPRENVVTGALLWLFVAAALAVASFRLFALAEPWGPMSLFTGPVAGVICTLNAIRLARGTGRVTHRLLSLIAIALMLYLIWMCGLFLMLSGSLN